MDDGWYVDLENPNLWGYLWIALVATGQLLTCATSSGIVCVFRRGSTITDT